MASVSRRRERRLDEEDERRAAEESKGSTRPELVLDVFERFDSEFVTKPKAAKARRHLKRW